MLFNSFHLRSINENWNLMFFNLQLSSFLFHFFSFLFAYDGYSDSSGLNIYYYNTKKIAESVYVFILLWKSLSNQYTVNSFCEFISKLIEIFHWIMMSIIPFVANVVFICWFAMNCLVLVREFNY